MKKKRRKDVKKIFIFEFPDYFPAIQNFEISDNKIYVQTSKIRDNKDEYIIMDLKGNILNKTFLTRYKKPSILSRLFGAKLSVIKNEKIYYLKENEEKEEWELHVEEITY